MYKLIAVDFDGTLLDDKKIVSIKTINKFKSLKEKGYLIVAVTARNFNSTKAVVDINLFDYLIVNNGAYLYDVRLKKGETLGVISKDSVLNIINDVKNVSNDIIVISNYNYFYYKGKFPFRYFFDKKINSLDKIKEDIMRINIIINNEFDINYYNDFIRNKYLDVNCFIMQDSGSNNKRISVNPKGINKKNILEKLALSLNIKLEEIIFFGDGLNDVELIESVGCGVAMKNAVSEVKDKAKYITLSNNEDGIVAFLDKFLDK